MIKKFKSHQYKDYYIPEFEIEKGDFVRIWINKVSSSFGSFESCLTYLSSEIRNGSSLSSNEYSLRSFNDFKINFWERIKAPSVEAYMTIHSNSDFDVDCLEQLKIQKEWKINKLGFTHMRIIQILVAYFSSEVLIFDNYGFSSDTEQLLMNFFINHGTSKTIIAFDDLNFFNEGANNNRIKDVHIDIMKKSI